MIESRFHHKIVGMCFRLRTLFSQLQHHLKKMFRCLMRIFDWTNPRLGYLFHEVISVFSSFVSAETLKLFFPISNLFFYFNAIFPDKKAFSCTFPVAGGAISGWTVEFWDRRTSPDGFDTLCFVISWQIFARPKDPRWHKLNVTSVTFPAKLSLLADVWHFASEPASGYLPNPRKPGSGIYFPSAWTPLPDKFGNLWITPSKASCEFSKIRDEPRDWIRLTE